MPKKIIVVFLLLVFANPVFGQKIKHPGQEVSGMLKLSYESKVILPKGAWTVAGITKSHGNPPWKTVSLVQSASNVIKAIIIIQYPGNPVKNGWYKGKDNTCDDYLNQNSNFHINKIKEKSNYIISGYCSSIYVENYVDASLWDSWDIMEKTHTYISDKNLIYPPALVIIDSKYYSKINLMGIYYAYNSNFSKVATSAKVNWKKSDWHKYNIEKYPSKNEFMNKVINSQKMTIENSFKGFDKRKPIDLSFYNFE